MHTSAAAMLRSCAMLGWCGDTAVVHLVGLVAALLLTAQRRCGMQHCSCRLMAKLGSGVVAQEASGSCAQVQEYPCSNTAHPSQFETGPEAFSASQSTQDQGSTTEAAGAVRTMCPG